MTESVFHFRNFSIYQHGQGLKLTTDAVLLGAWMGHCSGLRVLDVGCGTGILSLMAAQSGAAEVTAIDINEEACNVAAQNVAISVWKDAIHVQHAAFQRFFETNTQKFELIVCNPPYFKGQLQSATSQMALAKHTVEFHFPSFFSLASKALAPEGRICLIIPLGDMYLLCQRLAVQNGLYMSRFTKIFYRKGKAAERCMLEFTLKYVPLVQDELIIRDEQNQYTTQYKTLTSAFYRDEVFR